MNDDYIPNPEIELVLTSEGMSLLLEGSDRIPRVVPTSDTIIYNSDEMTLAYLDVVRERHREERAATFGIRNATISQPMILTAFDSPWMPQLEPRVPARIWQMELGNPYKPKNKYKYSGPKKKKKHNKKRRGF